MRLILRFLQVLLVGVPGALVFVLASVLLIGRLFESVPESRLPHPVILGAVSVAGALAMLFGSGRWGQWRYLLALAALPTILVASMFVVVPLGPGKDGLLLLPLIACPIVFYLLRIAGRPYHMEAEPKRPADALKDARG